MTSPDNTRPWSWGREVRPGTLGCAALTCRRPGRVHLWARHSGLILLKPSAVCISRPCASGQWMLTSATLGAASALRQLVLQCERRGAGQRPAPGRPWGRAVVAVSEVQLLRPRGAGGQGPCARGEGSPLGRRSPRKGSVLSSLEKSQRCAGPAPLRRSFISASTRLFKKLGSEV